MYVRELDSILLPRFAAEIQLRLVKYASDPARLYRYFKGYLMLSDTKHLDKDYLQSLANAEWGQPDGAGSARDPRWRIISRR